MIQDSGMLPMEALFLMPAGTKVQVCWSLGYATLPRVLVFPLGVYLGAAHEEDWNDWRLLFDQDGRPLFANIWLEGSG